MDIGLAVAAGLAVFAVLALVALVWVAARNAERLEWDDSYSKRRSS